jgi:hypothetical protein
MTQIEIFNNASAYRVNQWLEKNQDKKIIDIKHSVGGQNNVVVMIIYEKN